MCMSNLNRYTVQHISTYSGDNNSIIAQGQKQTPFLLNDHHSLGSYSICVDCYYTSATYGRNMCAAKKDSMQVTWSDI